MTYDQFVVLLQELQATDSTDTDFNTILPSVLAHAELMVYRDLDPVYARKYDQALTITAGSPIITLPTACWLVRKLTLVTGFGRSEITPRQKSYLDEYWPVYATTGTPKHYASPVEGTVLVVPTPGSGVVITVDYTYRPAPAVSGGTDWCLTNYSDLTYYAAAWWISGFSKAYAGEDPRGPGYWQALYERELMKARSEEARKKGEPAFDSGPTAPMPAIGG
jgi:hypothetical protein